MVAVCCNLWYCDKLQTNAANVILIAAEIVVVDIFFKTFIYLPYRIYNVLNCSSSQFLILQEIVDRCDYHCSCGDPKSLNLQLKL